MASEKPIRVAIIGLGFGAEFIPIYQSYPGAEIYAICRRDRKGLDECGDRYKIPARYTDYRELLKDPEIDAVHINSPIPDHAWMSIEALKAGKHVACTVPMGTSVDECRQIVEAQRASGKVYMMMETVVYSREYLFVKELYDKGELGRLQFLRGSHQQDMDGWPDYWPGLPPMWYATHCVSPCLAILGKHRRERRLPRLRPDPRGADRPSTAARSPSRRPPSPSRTPTSSPRSRAACSTPRGSTARASTPTAARRASSGSRSRARSRSSTPRARPSIRSPSRRSPSGSRCPTMPTASPEPIQRFTTKGVYSLDEGEQHLSFTQGGGHGGSHPHLVHAFLSAVRGERPALPDAETSANWTMVGLCAHESAMKGGERIVIPTF